MKAWTSVEDFPKFAWTLAAFFLVTVAVLTYLTVKEGWVLLGLAWALLLLGWFRFLQKHL